MYISRGRWWATHVVVMTHATEKSDEIRNGAGVASKRRLAIERNAASLASILMWSRARSVRSFSNAACAALMDRSITGFALLRVRGKGGGMREVKEQKLNLGWALGAEHLQDERLSAC